MPWLRRASHVRHGQAHVRSRCQRFHTSAARVRSDRAGTGGRTCADLPDGLAGAPLDDCVRVACRATARGHQRRERRLLQQCLAAALGDLRDGEQRRVPPLPLAVLGPRIDEGPEHAEQGLAADGARDAVERLQRVLVQLVLPCTPRRGLFNGQHRIG